MYIHGMPSQPSHQAAGTLAWICLRDTCQPRAIAADPVRVREVQLRLVRGCGGPGVLLWPWQDLAPSDLHFEAANLLAVRGIWRPEADSVFFEPARVLTRRELARRMMGLLDALRPRPALPAEPVYADVSAGDPDRAAIEAMVLGGDFQPLASHFHPEAPATWATLQAWLTRSGLAASPGLLEKGRAELPLTRAEAAQHLWRALRLAPSQKE